MTTTFQIYVDRGNGLELDGCWGSEHAQFESQQEAAEAAQHLHNCYPDCEWVVVDEFTENEILRLPTSPRP